MSEKRYVIGLDLGQASDFTAVAVVESEWIDDRELETRVRHLDRWRGVSYVDVIERLHDLRAESVLTDAALVVDGTGVGRAVVDMLREARLRPIPVSITAGESAHRDEDRWWRVPKKELVGVVQVQLHKGRLKVASALPLAEVLLEELGGFEVRVTAAGNVQYGTWRDGAHDDLVLAAALSLWWARRSTPKSGAPTYTTGGCRRSASPEWNTGVHLGSWARREGRDRYVRCPEDAAAESVIGRDSWRRIVDRHRRNNS